MTYVLLMFLMLPVVRVQHVGPPVSSCPASCAVCSEDAVICQRLAHILDAPDSTQALLLTEGSISAVPPASLSDLINVTVIGLSHNRISELSAETFTSLPFLHTLLLDHNLLTSHALRGGALTNLSQLEVLSLGHNLITMIQASWFVGTKTLKSLKLEGNHLTKLESSSFPLRDLMYLESLDLSENLIHYLDENSFRGLVSLKTLDISRNRLSSAPVEAFSYLNWLTNLNMDLNSWNCSCQLLELATFLSTFMQQPDKALYNGRRMVCVSADNPAVTTVLELTDANCVPSNQNITIQVQNKGSVTPHVYARDVAIAAVICFIGGVGITLLVVLILYQVSQKKKLKEIQRLKVESEESQGVANHHIRHFSVSEGRPYEANSNNQQQLKEASTFDPRTQMWNGAEENSSYYNEFRPNAMRRENRMNGGIETEEARERSKLKMMKMMMEEEKRRAVAQHSDLNTPNGTGTIKGGGHENIHCDCSYKTYRPPEQNVRQGRHDGFSLRHRPNGGGHHLDMMRNADFRRDTRKVTFDPESLRLLEQRSSWDEERYGRRRMTTSRDKERRHKAQSSRLHKVKLHLNPQRKSKIHPRKKSEHLDESSTRKDKEKDGPGRDVRERKRQKLEMSSKSERSKLEEKTEEEDGEEEGKTRKAILKQKKTISKENQEKKERTEDAEDKSERAKREDSPPSDSTNAVDVPEQQPNLQDVQYQGTGSTQASEQPSSQPPVALSNADTTCTPSFPPAGPAGSHVSSSSSLQGGNALFNSLNLAANAMSSSGPTVSTVSAPNMGPGLALDNLGIQAAVGATYNVSSLLASTQHANSLQASAIHTVPPLNLAANEAGNATTFQSSPQSQLAPESSPLAFRMNPDPGQGYPAAVLELPLLESAESMITRDTLLVGDQGNPSDVTNLNTESASTLENMSNNNSQRLIPHNPLELGFGESLPAEGVSALVTSTRRASSSGGALLQQEYLSEEGGSSPRRKLRLVLPEKSPSRPPTALERKIR